MTNSFNPAAQPNRFYELLEALRSEFELQKQSSESGTKMSREDYDLKVQQHMAEMSMMQRTVAELERSFVKLKQEYEDEIARLKGEPVPERPTLQPIGPTAPGQIALSTFHVGEKRTSSSASLEEVQRVTRPRESSTSSVASSTSSAPPNFDWIVTYNPKVPRNISVSLAHTIGFEGVVCCVRFSQSGKLLAISGNRLCNIVDVTTGNRLASIPHGDNQNTDLYVRSVSFSTNDKWFATGSEDHLIRVWNLESLLAAKETPAVPEKILKGHTQDVYTLEFIDQNRLVSGSGDETLRIWDIESGECKHVVAVKDRTAGGQPAFTSLAISHSRRYVVAGALDKVVRVCDLEADVPSFTSSFAGHTDSIYSVCFTNDDSAIISGSLDKAIRRWDFATGACLSEFTGHKDFVLSVAIGGQRGNLIISGSKDRSVQFWDAANQNQMLTLQGHKNSVISVAVNPTGLSFATGSGDGRARIWTLTEKD